MSQSEFLFSFSKYRRKNKYRREALLRSLGPNWPRSQEEEPRLEKAWSKFWPRKWYSGGTYLKYGKRAFKQGHWSTAHTADTRSHPNANRLGCLEHGEAHRASGYSQMAWQGVPHWRSWKWCAEPQLRERKTEAEQAMWYFTLGWAYQWVTLGGNFPSFFLSVFWN